MNADFRQNTIMIALRVMTRKEYILESAAKTIFTTLAKKSLRPLMK
jgi:hypothetical protein